MIQQPDDAVIMLWCYHHHGRGNGIFGVARSTSLAKDRAAVADVAGLYDHERAFVLQKLIRFVAKLGAFLLLGCLRWAERAEESW